MEHSPLILLSMIGLAGILCQWLAWRMDVPAILPLLITGIIAGPVTGVLDPDALFGDLLFPMVSIGVAIILFEGSLTLRLNEVKSVERVVRNLVTVGALLTAGILAVATHWLLDLSWGLSCLFGAVMTVTGPTVIKPLLRSARLSEKTARVLQWEGIILDPLGAMLTLLVFDYIVSGQASENPWIGLMQVAGVGGLLGFAGARLVSVLLARDWLPHYLEHVFTLVLVVAVFAVSNSLAHEAGLLAVTIMGMMLANDDRLDIDELLYFKESISVLLISVLFIVLAARMELAQLVALGWPALVLFGVVVLVARPISIFFCTRNSALTGGERLVLAWVAPRGIIAAAVSALFALRLESAGYSEAQVIVPLTFLMIIGTVTLQSLTTRWLAARLNATAPEPTGFLIVGANSVARAIGGALQSAGFVVRLADTGWENVRAARMGGLETYFGGAVSEHAENNLVLSGIGRLLAMSPHPAINALACVRYKHDFGPTNLYRLSATVDKKDSLRRSLPVSVAGKTLFGKDVTHSKLASLISKGAKIRTTRITEDFGFDAYLEKNSKGVIPLFVITKDGNLQFFTGEMNPKPKPGSQIGSLVPAAQLEQEQAQKEETRAARQGASATDQPATG